MTPLHIQLNTERFTYYAILVVGFFVISSFVVLIAQFIERIEDKWDNNYREINQEKYPKMCKLKKLRHSIFYYTQPQRKKQAIKTKIKSYDVEATLLDIMMTTQQLYKANNPLWARGVSLDEIEVVEMLSGNDDAKNEILKFLKDK